MIKYFFTNSIGILFSRILGFARDVMSANILGVSIYSDMFFVAFKIPNLFRRIFGEGAFSQTFIPFFASCDKKVAFTNYVFYKLFFIILSLSIPVSIFPLALAHIFAMGFSQESKELVAPLIAINFYYLDMIFIVMLLSAILQYKYHFATSSFSTAILNISLLISMWYSSKMLPMDIIYYMSYGVLIGGALQVVVHIIALRYIKMDKIFRVPVLSVFKKTKAIKEDIKKFNNSFVYSILGNSTAHISAFIDTFLASFLISGSISYLYYANRLFQLPMALFSIALSMSIFPILVKMIKNNQEQKALKNIQNSFYFLLYTLTMATAIGIIFSKEIIWLLFERGEFSHKDTIESAVILSMYLVGLLPFGLSKVFSVWLFSKKLHKKVAKISAYSLGLNILLSLSLIYPMGARGLALASSISGVLLLFLNMRLFGMDKIRVFLYNKIIFYFLPFIVIFIGLLYKLSSFISF